MHSLLCAPETIRKLRKTFDELTQPDKWRLINRELSAIYISYSSSGMRDYLLLSGSTLMCWLISRTTLLIK